MSSFRQSDLPQDDANSGPIDLIRRKLAREPEIHGGKKSRVVFTDDGEKRVSPDNRSSPSTSSAPLCPLPNADPPRPYRTVTTTLSAVPSVTRTRQAQTSESAKV